MHFTILMMSHEGSGLLFQFLISGQEKWFPISFYLIYIYMLIRDAFFAARDLVSRMVVGWSAGFGVQLAGQLPGLS